MTLPTECDIHVHIINGENKMKVFDVQSGIGKSKYVVNFHDGVKTHQDGSPFYDIKLFKNKRKEQVFIRTLCKKGYKKSELVLDITH